MKTLLTMMMVACLVSASGANELVAESEPNDTLVSADGFRSLRPGSQIIATGYIYSGSRDVDIYRVEIASDAVGPFRLTTEVTTAQQGTDLYMRIFDADGNQIASNDDQTPGEADPASTITILKPQQLFIGISSNSNTLYDPTSQGSGFTGAGGAYRLFVALSSERSPQSNREPNDELERATPLGLASTELIDQFIGDGELGVHDVDYYNVFVLQSSLVRVTISPSDGSAFDPYLRVLTGCPSCRALENDDIRHGTRAAQVTVPLYGIADAYFEVSGAPREPRSHGSLGYYDVEVVVEPFAPSGHNEPNDSIPMAVPIGGGGPRGTPEEVELDAFLGDGPYAAIRGDRDFYAYWAPVDPIDLFPQPRFIEVTVSAVDDSFVPIISAFDIDARLFVRTGGTPGDAGLVLPGNCLEQDHDYGPALYFAVTSAGQRPILDPNIPTENGTPEPTFEEHVGQTGPYRLTVHPMSPQPGCGGEPNDTLSSASPTGLCDSGTYVCGPLELGDHPQCPYEDVDMWSFEVNRTPAFLNAAVSTCLDDELSSYTLRLFDPQGNVVASFNKEVGEDFFDRATMMATLMEPGRYVLALSGDIPYGSQVPYDPSVECTVLGSDHGFYHIAITVAQGPPDAPLPTIANSSGEPTPIEYVYASQLDGAAATINVLDGISGKVLTDFAAPEEPMTGVEAIVPHADGLLFAGMGRYPTLYQLTPFTGEILGSFIGWFGSGQYSDAVMLADTLYVLDIRQQSIHAVDPQGRFVKRTLPVGNRNAITIGGGLAALSAPNRLFVADAFDSRRTYEIDPNTGALLRTLPETGLRAVALGGVGASELFVGDWTQSRIDVLDRDGAQIDSIYLEGPPGSIGGTAYAKTLGDVNGDGQIDLRDVALFYQCFGLPSGAALCGAADLDEDGWIAAADAELLTSNLVGP